jgi:hypothetical protein
MEYTKIHKKIKMISEHLIRKKDFWYKKITCQHAFLKCFKHIKRFLKHGEFSWKFCNYNFENYIRNYFKNKINFWYMFPWWFFKSSKNNFWKLYTHWLVLFFFFPPYHKVCEFFWTLCLWDFYIFPTECTFLKLIFNFSLISEMCLYEQVSTTAYKFIVLQILYVKNLS